MTSSTVSTSTSLAYHGISESCTRRALSVSARMERNASIRFARSPSESSMRGSRTIEASGKLASTSLPMPSSASRKLAGPNARRQPNDEADHGRRLIERVEAKDHDRTHLPGVDRGPVGSVDDEGRHRVMVGPGRIRGEGPNARPPPRRRAGVRNDRDRSRAGRVHEERRDACDDRGASYLHRGRRAAAPRVHTPGNVHSGCRPLRRRDNGRTESDFAGRADGPDLRCNARRPVDAAGGHGLGKPARQALEAARASPFKASLMPSHPTGAAPMIVQVANTNTPPRNLLRSTGAVLAGMVAVIALSLGPDQLLHVLEVYPPWGQAMHEPGLNILALSAFPCTWLGWMLSRARNPRLQEAG